MRYWASQERLRSIGHWDYQLTTECPGPTPLCSRSGERRRCRCWRISVRDVTVHGGCLRRGPSTGSSRQIVTDRTDGYLVSTYSMRTVWLRFRRLQAASHHEVI